MPIYVYQGNKQISTNAIRNNKVVQAIYAKEQGKDIVCVWGDDFAGSLLTYTVTNDKATITGFRSNYQHNGYLKIPNRIKNTLIVTAIGYSAFDGCVGLTGITIPSSVNDIKDYAFRGCSNLTKIIGSSSVAPIVAKQCKSNSFEVIITSGTKININFAGCIGLTSITIPTNIISIEGGTFNGCSSLKSITIPFAGRRANDSTSIGDWRPFGHIFGTSKYTGSYEAYQHIGYNDHNTYYIPSSLTTVIFNGHDILPYAFENCTSLTSITMSDNLTSIGRYAFSGCRGLTSIEVPNSVTSIDKDAFEYCTGLTSVTIGNSVTSISEYAFWQCTSLTQIVIPDKVTSIGKGAFRECSRLTNITFNGTKAQWNAITKGSYWDTDTGNYTIHCTDGDIPKQ